MFQLFERGFLIKITEEKLNETNLPDDTVTWLTVFSIVPLKSLQSFKDKKIISCHFLVSSVLQ